jgi:hypothetical protein
MGNVLPKIRSLKGHGPLNVFYLGTVGKEESSFSLITDRRLNKSWH